LYEYVFATVVEGARRLDATQEPVLNIVEGVGPFPVALRTVAPVDTLGPRPPTQPSEPAAPPMVDVVSKEELERFRFAAQPLDDNEDILGAFYGNQNQWGGVLVVTNRRIMIGKLGTWHKLGRKSRSTPQWLEDIQGYAESAETSNSLVSSALYRYYKATKAGRPESILLTDVTRVRAARDRLITAPALEIDTKSGETVRWAVVAKPTSTIWNKQNRAMRDRAIEIIDRAVTRSVDPSA
jgi:hypothetical protein